MKRSIKPIIFILLGLFALEALSNDELYQNECIQALEPPKPSYGNTIENVLRNENDVNINRLQALLDTGVDPNQTFSTGESPIEYVLKDKNGVYIDRLQALLDYGADPNQTFSTGESPIEYVIRYRPNNKGTIEILKLLIDAGADVNEPFSNGMPPIEYLIKFALGYVPLLQIDNLVKPTVNHAAMMLDLFIKAGVNVQFHLPLENDKFTTLKALSWISDFEKYSFTPGKPATISLSITKAQLFVFRNTDANSNDWHGMSLLERNMKIGTLFGYPNSPRLVWIAIQVGADVNKPFSDGKLPLEYMLKYVEHSTNMVNLRLLIDAGADVNKPFSNGMSSLEFLEYLYRTKLSTDSLYINKLTMLIEAGADPNQPFSVGELSGISPIEYLVRLKSEYTENYLQTLNALNILITAGADTDKPFLNGNDQSLIESLLSYYETKIHLSTPIPIPPDQMDNIHEISSSESYSYYENATALQNISNAIMTLALLIKHMTNENL